MDNADSSIDVTGMPMTEGRADDALGTAYKKPKTSVAKVIITDMAGAVPPRVGSEFIACERREEVNCILNDLTMASENYSTIRFLEGEFGAGKSFMKQIIKYQAMRRGYVVMDAQLSTDRLLVGSNVRKEGLNTYRELVSNMSTKTTNSGGALEEVLQSFLSHVRGILDERSGCPSLDDYDWSEYLPVVEESTKEMANDLNYVDFLSMVGRYHDAIASGSSVANIVKWFKGEFNNLTELNECFPKTFRAYVTDATWYSYIRMWSDFVVCAGYKGLVVILDEFKVVSRIKSDVTRNKNYDFLLSIYNELHDKRGRIAMYICVTPDTIKNPDNGLYSYEALRSRLDGFDVALLDRIGPVMRLNPLTPNGAVALLYKLKEVYEIAFKCSLDFGMDEIKRYVAEKYTQFSCSDGITPRTLSKGYITIMDTMRQNSSAKFAEIMEGLELLPESDPTEALELDVESEE